MRIHLRTLGYGAGVLLGLALTTAVQAQAPGDGVHRMEIYNGPRLTVRYFSGRVSPGEASSLRDLERTENESNYVASLQGLKREYVTNERSLEDQRRRMQQQLYATTFAASTGGAFGYGGLAFTEAGILNPALVGYGGYGGYGGYYGGVYAPSYTTAYGAGYSVLGGIGATGALSRSLAANISNAGPLKTNIAQVIAHDSTDAHAAAVNRDLDRAVAVVGGSPALRTALKMPNAREAYIRPVASDASGPVTVILNDGTKIPGSRMEETKDWTIIYTKSGRTRVRPTEIKRIEEGGSGVGPAGGS